MTGILAVLAFAILTGPLEAAECARTYFLDQYRAGLAALKKNDRAAAAVLQPLAEQGFAPAQRRLGEALAASGRPDARSEGLAWLRLAYRGGDELASESLAAVGATPEEIETATQATAGWTPRACDCMQEFARRLDSGQPVSLGDFSATLSVGKATTQPPQVLARQVLGVLLALYRTDANFLPYLRALDAVHVDTLNVFAQSARLNERSVLAFDEAMLTAPEPDRVRMMVRAAAEAVRTQVHDQADPPLRLSVSHRGRTIVAIGHGDASQAIEIIRKGIDLAETLPPDLRRLAGVVKDMRYEAPPLGEDVRTNGTYVVRHKLIWFKRHPSHVSARDIVAALVSNGVFAEAMARGDPPGPGLTRDANYQGQRARDNL